MRLVYRFVHLPSGTGSHWWVLDLGPLVSMTMSKGLSRGGSWCRKFLGSLSVNEWDCIPVLLVVWLKASQHWSLQAVR